MPRPPPRCFAAALAPLLLLGPLLRAVAAVDVHRRAPCAGELLWNGICLPPSWPPDVQLNRTVVAPPYLSTMKPAAINCSTGRQLFVDDFLTQHSTGLRQEFHAPEYDEVNPVIKPTEDWELMSTAYYGGFASAFSGGAFWNPAQHRYELFYKCGNSFCVAYSTDAMAWTKPKLRGNDFAACKGVPCNVVIDVDFDGASFWLDLDTKNASQRYIMASGPNIGHTGRPSDGGFELYSSPNGTAFVFETNTGPIQDRSSVYKDALRNRWVFSIKADGPATSPGRTRRYWESIGPDVLQGTQWGSISPKSKDHGKDRPPMWLDSDELDQQNVACNGNTQLCECSAQQCSLLLPPSSCLLPHVSSLVSPASCLV